jgi:hypothetical protein
MIRIAFLDRATFAVLIRRGGAPAVLRFLYRAAEWAGPRLTLSPSSAEGARVGCRVNQCPGARAVRTIPRRTVFGWQSAFASPHDLQGSSVH